jgi:hypothetical protein
MANELAPVYLDDARVQLQGDPRPKVAKIVAAGGKPSEHMRIVRLASLQDETGQTVGLDDVIDRSQQRNPVYLRLVDEGEATAGQPDADITPTGTPTLASDESTGVGLSQPSGSITQQESSGVGRGDAKDQASSIGNRVRPGTQFGAGRPGMAGQGAQGSPGNIPLDKQAKSDFDPKTSSGASNQGYGVGDLAPGGRAGIKGQPANKSSEDPVLDGTQEFQSGGRQGEGGAPPYSDVDVGSSGIDVEQTAQQNEGPRQEIRDSATDHSGRQVGSRPKRPSSTKAASGKADGQTDPEASD